jgi:hypothetical protein
MGKGSPPDSKEVAPRKYSGMSDRIDNIVGESFERQKTNEEN